MAKAAAKPAAKKAAAKSAKPAAAGPALRKEFDTDRFRAGLAMRRAVLGAEYVDASIAKADDFMVDFQKMVTEFCWGEIWTRPGLDRKTRSMLNLAMLTALNRPNELRLHIKGAVNNGVTRDEMKEIFLACCVYAGVPAGLDAFKIASDVFREADGK
ncbi:MAG: carboxymuconolactone decarboxylase family protein [Acetobacteraceae bacterium]|nr:carboxymuconolactone decarboxylase family protein [Acetobacteraceae bacterium]